MSRAGGSKLKQGAYYIQKMSNGDVFYCRIEGKYKNGNYAAGMVDCYEGMLGHKVSRVKKSRINNESLWKPVESLPEDVQAKFDAL
jgi:hypothetical protein